MNDYTIKEGVSYQTFLIEFNKKRANHQNMDFPPQVKRSPSL